VAAFPATTGQRPGDDFEAPTSPEERLTLLDLVASVQDAVESDAEVTSTLRHMFETGRVRLDSLSIQEHRAAPSHCAPKASTITCETFLVFGSRISRSQRSRRDFANPVQHEPGGFEPCSGGTDELAFRVHTEAGETVTTIRIEGQLTSASVADLRAACESANPPFRLDLSGLRSADSDGIRALQSLAEAGAELHGANPYINQLLLEANK
jgi:hypothetical protein